MVVVTFFPESIMSNAEHRLISLSLCRVLDDARCVLYKDILKQSSESRLSVGDNRVVGRYL